MEKKQEKEKKKSTKVVETAKERKIAGAISTRGRTFEGKIIKKLPKKITIEFERTLFIRKYERFMKKKTRIHARLPDDIDVEVGDLVRVRECRPLSKTIHFIFVEKINSGENNGKK